MSAKEPLPIDQHLKDIQTKLTQDSALIIRAEPGAGKTTRIPQAMLDICSGTIIVIEPRRLAAKLSCQRVASELGSQVGDLVGYQMRFESARSPNTRILFVTEGIFARYVQSDPSIATIDCVIIDEFHERHIQSDLALAICRKIKNTTRPDLKLVVMSATLDISALKTYLKTESLDVLGRTFPVTVQYDPIPEHRDKVQHLIEVISGLIQTQDKQEDSNILVFLTGLAEIRAMVSQLQNALPEQLVLALSAEISATEQQKIFAPSAKRKVILSTNVAETSLTLPDIGIVIDFGNAKTPSLAPWSGQTTIDIKRIPKSSCIQRAGRAGRTRHGLCVRLFAELDYHRRDDYLQPEICRLDFSKTLLDLLSISQPHANQSTKMLKAFDVKSDFLDPPPKTILDAAHHTLLTTGAITKAPSGIAITAFGHAMARLPLHPRAAALVIAGKAQGVPDFGIYAAALINEEGILGRRDRLFRDKETCDIHCQLQLIADAKTKTLNEVTLSPHKVAKVEKIAKNLQKIQNQEARLTSAIKQSLSPQAKLALLQGFSDRLGVMRLTKAKTKKFHQERAYNLSQGRGGRLADSSVLQKSEYIFTLVASESQEKNAARGTDIRLASEISNQILIDAHSPSKSERTALIWDIQKKSVVKFAIVNYHQIEVGKKPLPLEPHDMSDAQEIFAAEFKKNWRSFFSDIEDLDIYHYKIELLKAQNLEHTFPIFEGDMLDLFLETLCMGKSSIEDLSQTPLEQQIYAQLSYEELTEFQRLFPKEVRLAKGRMVKVHYEIGRPPYISSRLQDFFGMYETPSYLGGTRPFQIHLLAPNHRPAQLTSDLGGFWKNSYPAIRDELKRRYPKHDWPEDP